MLVFFNEITFIEAIFLIVDQLWQIYVKTEELFFIQHNIWVEYYTFLLVVN